MNDWEFGNSSINRPFNQRQQPLINDQFMLGQSYNNLTNFQQPLVNTADYPQTYQQYPQNIPPNLNSSHGYQQPFSFKNQLSAFNTSGHLNPSQLHQSSFHNNPNNFNNTHNDSSYFNSESPQHTAFLKAVQDFLVTHQTTLRQLCNDIGVAPDSTHITKDQLDHLGREARAPQLDQMQFAQLIRVLEDKTKLEYISIRTLEDKLNSYGTFSQKRIEANQIKSNKIQIIKAYLERQKFTNIDQCFPNVQTSPDGQKYLEKKDFQDFLESADKVGLPKTDSDAMVSLYEQPPSSGKISLMKLQKDIDSAQEIMTISKAQQVLDQIYESIKRHIARNEVNVVDIFKDSDNNDDYFDRKEIKNVLSRLGLNEVKEDQINAIFMIFDQRNTGKTDFKKILDEFFKYANSKKLKEPTHRFYQVYEQIRKYLRDRHLLSIGSIILVDSVNKQAVEDIDTGVFLNYLKNLMSINLNAATEQSLALDLSSSKGMYKIDFQKFADLLGYEFPNESANRQLKGRFYRILLQNIQNSQNLKRDLERSDINLVGTIHSNVFTNIILGHCPILVQEQNLIKLVASNFANQGSMEVRFQDFNLKLEYEEKKLLFLKKLYINMYETLDFQANYDLYSIFMRFDHRKDKTFDYQQLQGICNSLGITVIDQEIDYIMNEYDPDQNCKVAYSKIENDYNEFIGEERKKGKLTRITNLPYILETLKYYLDYKGLTLRQVFGKTKVGDTDQIKQYQFQKIVSQIGSEVGRNIESNAITKFMQMIQASGQANNQNVSFTELARIFNEQFNIKDSDDQQFIPFYIDTLQKDIAKIAIDRKASGFQLESHFLYPQSSYSQFMLDLNKDPLFSSRTHQQQTIDEMAKIYMVGGYVNTQQFIADIRDKMFKQEQKTQLYMEIRKQIMLKNIKIEDVFKRAIPEIHKFNITQLSPQEFQKVFLFAEYKISIDKVTELFQTFFQADDQGKYSYLDFIKDFTEAEKLSLNQIKGGRRFYQTLEDILKRIASMIEQRQLRTFGSLLADQDLNGKQQIEKDQFFRTLDSLQFGLGQGDIQELIRTFSKSDTHLDILRFKDALNPYIINPEFKIQLKSLVNLVVQERVVEVIEQTPRNQKEFNEEALQKYMNLIKEIVFGLYAKEAEVTQWFTKYSSSVKGSLTNKEFIAGIEGLGIYDSPDLKQGYYDSLVGRQETSVGYKAQLLLIDQFHLLLHRDYPGNRQQAVDDLLYDIAQSLTATRTPIMEALSALDPNNTGLIYRNDFLAQLLDNYLHLAPILNFNKKQLLTTRYAPNESYVQFQYKAFIQDLQRQQFEHPRTIKIFMTRAEEQQDSHLAAQQLATQIMTKEQPVMNIPDPDPQSKKNTVCTEKTCKKPMKVQIPAFQFDDIMLETYRRGVAVEEYFKAYGKYSNGQFILNKDDFMQAIAKLGVTWGKENVKLSEMFDALDMAANATILRKLSNNDIGEAILQNALYTTEDYQAKSIEAIYEALKKRGLLGKLRDLFNFFNTRRDSTCASKEFKTIILEKLDLKIVNEQQIEMLIYRYKSMADGSRVDFTLFIKDMEYCDQGISASLIWAIEFAEDIIKGLIVNNLSDPDQLFSKYSKMRGILLFEEFTKAIDELGISIYHDEETQKDFFNHVQMQQNKDTVQGNQNSNFSKVSLVQLVSTIKRLCQKTMGQLYQDILEKIYAESKKNNLSVTVFTIFTDFDFQKSGHVPFIDFKSAIEDKLNIRALKNLDIQVLAKRYRSNQRGVPDDMVQYEKFFQDYEKLEKLGLQAGYDPLKQKQMQDSYLKAQPVVKEQSPESKKIYLDMSNYSKKMSLIDALCDGFARKDQNLRGMLSFQDIHDVFKQFKITLNTKQMSCIVEPLPAYPLDGAFNYLIMIEFLFGKDKALDVQRKFQLQGMQAATVTSNSHYAIYDQIPVQQSKPMEMSVRLRDFIELKYHQILAAAHSISKGSYLFREPDLYNVFKKVNIMLLSSDLDLLAQAYRQLTNIKTGALDFKSFLQYFHIQQVTSLIIQEIQKEIAAKNVKLEEALLIQEYLTLDEFKQFLTKANIELRGFTPEELAQCFAQMAERKQKIEKASLIRLIRNESDQNLEWLPYIANELIYFIFNNNINLFKFVNPQAKKLTTQQFNSLLTQIAYKPSNLKELPTLLTFFAMDADPNFISIEKLIIQIRKLDHTYAGGQIATNNSLPTQQKNDKQSFSKQLSQFSPKIKQILQKINDQLKRNGQNAKIIFNLMDVNKNGIVEKPEFIGYFNKEFQVKGLVQADYELLYDSLDMNKDAFLSVNEFCLCLEGIQMSLDQKLKAFDLDLEKSLQQEINTLFEFFDTNKDNSISMEELTFALRSLNPYLAIKEVQEIMKIADKNMSGTIDRQEFMALMLPKFKQEILDYEKNLDDLRRLFKEADLDQSNYLSKDEMRNALLKLSIELTDVQMEDLMRELDLDGNQSIDIDEFVAFLSIADQVKFKNPQNKSVVVKIKQSRKLQPMDFYNCFKNLPQFFLPSFTQETLEKKYHNTPSQSLYPEFDSKSMTYKDLAKLEDFTKHPMRKFIDMYVPGLACEIQIEEATGVPLPRKDDFDWSKISHRELRAVLIDMKTHEFLSNSFIIGASWRTEYPAKWLFNSQESVNASRQFVLRTELGKGEQVRDMQLLFELVLYTNATDGQQQVSCAWGTIPIQQLDKTAKMKVLLKGGSPFYEIKIDQAEIHQEKKGFAFLKRAAASTEDPLLILNVKPWSKFQELTQYHLSALPTTCLVQKRLLSFCSAFRVYCYQKLSLSQHSLIAPSGNFVIAQFRKIFDNPDVNLLLGDCWEFDITQKAVTNLDTMIKKMEEFMTKLYAIVYAQEFKMDHVFPTRSSGVESEAFQRREFMIKQALIPGKAIKKKQELKAPIEEDTSDYKPFNIAEMEINIMGIDNIESKQDELIKMYQQMGLIY